MSELRACLVQSTPSDVTDPFDCFVVAVVQFRLKHFEISYLQSRGRIGYLIE